MFKWNLICRRCFKPILLTFLRIISRSLLCHCHKQESNWFPVLSGGVIIARTAFSLRNAAEGNGTQIYYYLISTLKWQQITKYIIKTTVAAIRKHKKFGETNNPPPFTNNIFSNLGKILPSNIAECQKPLEVHYALQKSNVTSQITNSRSTFTCGNIY